VKLGRVLLIACLVPVLASCNVDGPSTPVPNGPTYTCCATGDIDRDYRAGETLTLHWIVVPGQPGGAPPNVELNAWLSGPYSSVTELKSAEADMSGAPGSFMVKAEPVRPSGAAGEQPISRIAIPPTTAAGYYNLVTSIGEPGSSVTGATIIRIVA
jgi:hypothetical protein